ncbi:hypothetical protein B0T17DRAFT_592387 [Bombardia bombarda]|uniref:Uncharacterized protein n=1 Tax=Bombardia bombarda TaxID=252184 RepID=A0AA40BVY2_9PEZI|nr:hypothetical protein B0T17DRAFT_592387 [Bombardia bombarda]
MSATATTVWISGANKGIGKGLANRYLSRPNTTVIVSVRNPASDEAQVLAQSPKHASSKLIIVKVESISDTDATEAVTTVTRDHGVDHVDIVIANAAVFTNEAAGKAIDLKAADLLHHVDANAGGPLRLFQATLSLLHKSKKPIFLIISSLGGSIGGMNEEFAAMPVAAYGASKSAANYLARRIHFEHPELISYVIHPGGVQTEGSQRFMTHVGFGDMITAWASVDQSVDGIVKSLDEATREKTSGTFASYDGEDLAW